MSGRPCELKKLQALWDPRTPVQPAYNGYLERITAALQPHVAAAEATDAAIDKAKGTAGEKAFRTLQARVAMAGMQLVRTDARDGPQRLFVVNGLKAMEIRHLDDLEALENYLQGR